jgi:hypothetical protein
MPGRELSDDAILHQAESLREYLMKPGNLGACIFLDSKDFSSADRSAIVLALADLEDLA